MFSSAKSTFLLFLNDWKKYKTGICILNTWEGQYSILLFTIKITLPNGQHIHHYHPHLLLT